MRQRVGDLFATTNLLEATYLSYKGFEYRVDRTDPASVIFVFTDTRELAESLITEFWDSSKERKLLSEYRDIKKITIMQSYKKNYYDNNRNDGRKTSNEGSSSHSTGQGKPKDSNKN